MCDLNVTASVSPVACAGGWCYMNVTLRNDHDTAPAFWIKLELLDDCGDDCATCDFNPKP